MNCVHLIHWNAAEGDEKERLLAEAGFSVSRFLPSGSAFFKDVELEQPTALVIDLSRLPSQGRDLAVNFRNRKGTRHIPILFVEGASEKVEAVRQLLPDAVYCTWTEVPGLLHQVIEQGVSESVVVPGSAFAAYAGKPLAEKLGIKPGFKVALLNTPAGFTDKLGSLTEGVQLFSVPANDINLSLCFLDSSAQMQSRMDELIAAAKQAPLWLAWRKKEAAASTDLTQVLVRKLAMQAGMVDYKICSIDEDWSALLFKWRGIS